MYKYNAIGIKYIEYDLFFMANTRQMIRFTLYTLQKAVRYLLPYHVEKTGSRPITEVKQRRAWLVLRWVTAWERHLL